MITTMTAPLIMMIMTTAVMTTDTVAAEPNIYIYIYIYIIIIIKEIRQ